MLHFLSRSISRKSGLAGVFAAILVTGALTVDARAATYDLNLSYLNTDGLLGYGVNGTGQITLDTPTGISTAGVSAFSFSGQVDFTGSFWGGIASPQGFVFALPDLNAIAWSTAPGTGALSIGFSTNAITNALGSSVCFMGAINTPIDVSCTVNGLTIGLSTGDSGAGIAVENSTGTITDGAGFTSSPPPLTATLVSTSPTPVPEPASLALFGFGLLSLAGIGFARRRNQRALS
jgi:hypothetical protein